MTGPTHAAPEKARGASAAVKDDPSLVRARELYTQARELGEAGKYQEAYKVLQETWSLHKHWVIVGYLAYLELKLGRYRESAEHSMYALRSLDEKAEEKDRREIREHHFGRRILRRRLR